MRETWNRIDTGSENKRVVLVVEDEELVRNFMRRVLAGAGYEVLSARDGEEALAVLKVARIDLVITDIRMPVMGGLELGTQISRFPLAPPVIYVSASDHPPLSSGAWYLEKPFRAAQLTQLVREVLSRTNQA